MITPTQVTDSFGDETAKILAAIVSAQSLIARKEHVLHPSDEADLPKIVSRRLFAKVDSGSERCRSRVRRLGARSVQSRYRPA